MTVALAVNQDPQTSYWLYRALGPGLPSAIPSHGDPVSVGCLIEKEKSVVV